MPFLLFVDERGQARSYAVNERVAVGRLPENDLVLRDDLVSRKHCLIEKDGSGWKLTDLGSRFGTFLNDERVSGSVALSPGDRLRIGNTPITFSPELTPVPGGVVPTDGPTGLGGKGGSLSLAAKLGAARAYAEEVVSYLKEPTGKPAPLEQAKGVLTRISDAEAELSTMERTNVLAEALAEMGHLVHRKTDLDEVLKLTMDQAVHCLGAERGYILLRDESSGRLLPRTSRNMGDMRGISTSIAEQVANEAKEVLTVDATVDPRFMGAHSVMAHGIHSVMCVPLMDKAGRALGAIYVDGRPGNPMFSPVGLEFMKSFASQAGLAMENATLTERSQRLSRYFSAEVLKDILAKNLGDELRGRRKVITVLFTDIRGFTAMMESLAPTAAVEMLREYFTEIVDALFEENGNLDKYTGDGIMAFWGAPADQPDHALRAVRAALKMQARMPPLRERWKKENRSFAGHGAELTTGIGIHTGEAVVGDIGSLKRLEYTGIGDAVNLASRVQGVAAGGEVLITESTLEMVRGKVEVEPLPPATLKGKAKPVPVFRVTRLV